MKGYAKIKYYILAVLVVLGLFTWAGFTGTRLLGDDNTNTEDANSYGSSGRSSGHGYTRFYHK